MTGFGPTPSLGSKNVLQGSSLNTEVSCPFPSHCPSLQALLPRPAIPMPILVFSDSSIHDGETLTPPGSHTVLLLLAASGAQDLCLQGSEDRHRAHSTGSLCQGQQWGRNLFQSRTQPPPTPAAEKQGTPSHSRDFFGSPFLSCPSEVALSYI